MGRGAGQDVSEGWGEGRVKMGRRGAETGDTPLLTSPSFLCHASTQGGAEGGGGRGGGKNANRGVETLATFASGKEGKVKGGEGEVGRERREERSEFLCCSLVRVWF